MSDAPRRSYARFAPIATAVAVWLFVVASDAGFGASARPIVQGFVDPPPAGALGFLGKLGAASAVLPVWRALLAAAQLAGVVAVAWRWGNRAAATAAPLALLLWPASRTALLDIGAEGLIASGLLAVIWATAALARHPRVAACVGGVGLTGLTLAAPLGLWLAVPSAVWLAMAPGAREAEDSATQLRARPIWVAWVAALAVWAALLTQAIGADHAKDFWNAMIATLRAPSAGLVGDADATPVLGTVFAALAGTPLVVLAGQVLRRAGGPPATGPIWLALAIFAIAGRPGPTPLALLGCLGAPLVAVAVAGAARALPRPDARWLVAALLLATGGESLYLEHRGGTLVGGVLRPDPDRAEPARLSPDDVQALRDAPGQVSVHPGRRGGDALVAALVRIEWLPGSVKAWHPFATQRVLLRAGPLGREGWAWWSTSDETLRVGDASLREVRAAAGTVGD